VNGATRSSASVKRCPTRDELPPPPMGKTGWPWTEESPRLPDTMPGGQAWPVVSVVTPSFNQGEFIEETIRSVLLQGYPNLEYIVIDGGSTDDSVDVIRRYEAWLAYWVSEPDRGQPHAINKGFEQATGQLVAWLNSDDTYLPKTLHHVVSVFQRMPQVGLVFGSALYVDRESQPISVYAGVDQPFFRKLQYWRRWEVPQPTLFFRRGVLERCGGMDESCQLVLDYDWVLRAAKSTLSHCSDTVLATYRLHQGSKTVHLRSDRRPFDRECARVVRKHAPRSSRLFWQLQGLRLADHMVQRVARAWRAVRTLLSKR
jgi:glycosyltransferase involved in cell wall biosynthesis